MLYLMVVRLYFAVLNHLSDEKEQAILRVSPQATVPISEQIFAIFGQSLHRKDWCARSAQRLEFFVFVFFF